MFLCQFFFMDFPNDMDFSTTFLTQTNIYIFKGNSNQFHISFSLLTSLQDFFISKPNFKQTKISHPTTSKFHSLRFGVDEDFRTDNSGLQKGGESVWFQWLRDGGAACLVKKWSYETSKFFYPSQKFETGFERKCLKECDGSYIFERKKSIFLILNKYGKYCLDLFCL